MSPEDQARNRRINKELEDQAKQAKREHKLLLLGAGESGKTTLFKQMKLVHGNKLPVEERLTYVVQIHENIIRNLRILANNVDQHAGGLANKELEDSKQYISAYKNPLINDEYAAHAIKLWADPNIKKCGLEAGAKFQYQETVAVFCDQIESIVKSGWVPTINDVMKARKQTSGVHSDQFIIPSEDGTPNTFCLLDVGGQRGERKKWLPFFDNVSCVLFVAAISEYDQVLVEDNKVNRLQEAINLFETMVNTPAFAKTPFMLFLNKRDLFKEKIQRVPIQNFFPDYEGPEYETDCNIDELEEIQGDFLKMKFLERVVTDERNPRDVPAHLTMATDTSNAARIFQTVRDAVLIASLRQAGLVYY